jgi:hypothetical protein
LNADDTVEVEARQVKSPKTSSGNDGRACGFFQGFSLETRLRLTGARTRSSQCAASTGKDLFRARIKGLMA